MNFRASRAHARTAVAALLLHSAISGCSEPSADYGPSVGVILDYTGSEASGFNEERALLLAADLLDDNRDDQAPMRFVFRDSRDDPEAARQAAEELAEAGVDVVIGPSTDRLVPMVAEVLDEADIVLMSPNPTIGDWATDERPWFRMSPGNLTGSTTPALVGEHLATEFESRAARRVVIVEDNDVYNVELARGFSDALTRRGGEVLGRLKADATDARQLLTLLNDNDVDGVLAATSILPAARLVWDVHASAEKAPTWLLTPRLKSEAFTLNTPPGALEGAFGISLRIPERVSGCDETEAEECFADVMRDTWGEDAYENMYFMYDAAALALIAVDRVWHQNAAVDRESLSEAIFSSAERGGVLTDWNDLSTAVESARVGRSVQYSGLTGPVVFTATGARVGGQTTVFEVKNHVFVDVER